MQFHIQRFETLESTNSEAARQAKLGGDEGLCIVAEQQSAGRGRHGRTWLSEKGAGLYVSIVMRPKLEMRFLPLLTLAAAVAVHDALAELGLKPDIKWVNDVLIDEEKISGILVETVDTPSGMAAVLGIGINLSSRNFPDEIAQSATSIAAELPGTDITADRLLELLIQFVSYFYDMLHGDNGPGEIRRHWQNRSTYANGKHVRVHLGRAVIEGITNGIEENGALRVKMSDGSVRIVQAGDVERLRRQ